MSICITTYDKNCIYCGDPATSIDHIPPRVIRKSYRLYNLERKDFFTVPACHDCNVRCLGANGPWILKDRIQFVKNRIRELNKKVLALPDWTPEELSQLAPGLRSSVLSGLQLRASVRRRLAFIPPNIHNLAVENSL